MSTKKMERALYGPSTTEVALGALLGLLAGGALAVIYLISRPVQTVREVPKEPVVGAIYYIQGAESGAKSRDWQEKQTQLIAGNNVTVVEDELNAWANSIAPAPSVAAQPVAGQPAPAREGFIIPARPNFRVVGEQLQVGVPVTLDYFGLSFETTVIATGDFKKSGDVVVFSPEKVYLGSCPLHFLPGAGGLLVSNLISKGKFPDELRSAWARVDAVSIGGGSVRIAAQ